MNDARSGPGDARHRILVIDDEPVVCLSCSRILGRRHSVESRQDPREGLEVALHGDYDLVLLDMVMPGMDGLEVLRQLRGAGVRSEVVIITGYSTVQNAVDAMKLGATDYVSKPFTPDELSVVVERVLERSKLIRENAVLREQLASEGSFEGMIGASRPMEEVFRLLRRVAPTDSTVLVEGESGTGKEMVARAIHRLSPRRDQAFLACDCSALVPTLLESELFGHVKGSFSGAVATKQGLFEAAHRGTLFLDEVSNISLETQGKLLRVLETRMVRRVGDTAEREVDIRLVAASNRDLTQLVREGKFREDLFYRLNVVPVTVPPLRERTDDVPRLALTFLERFRRHNPVKAEGFTPETFAALEAYAWPGNVRELKNIVERLAILCDAERIEPHHLPPELRPGLPSRQGTPLPRTWEEFKRFKREIREATIDDLERRFLLEALGRTDGNVTRAAEDVGMLRTNFHALLRKHGIGSEED